MASDLQAFNRVIEAIDTWIIAPGACATLLSGLALARARGLAVMGTTWLRLKLFITAFAILFGFFFVARWLERGGRHSEGLHESLFKNLVVAHIQLDELVNKVRRGGQWLWVWTAEDALSKAWLAWYVGRRTQADAHRLVHRVFVDPLPGAEP